MKANERLEEIKEDLKDAITIDRYVSLTNPKNVELMEALTAWTSIEVNFDGNHEVNENTNLRELWNLCSFDAKEFSDTAGMTLQDGLSKFRQMKNLSIIFPDGTADSKAKGIVKVYVHGKLGMLDKDAKKKKEQ